METLCYSFIAFAKTEEGINLGKPFISEIEKLNLTLAWAAQADTSSLSEALSSNATRPCIAVGSGGSFSSAEFQAYLHRVYFGSLAVACTPMELLEILPRDRWAAVWFQSASGNNIDIRRSFKHSVLNEIEAVNALLGSTESKLSELANEYTYTGLFEFDLPAGKDGFLATNSLLGLSAILLKGYLSACGKPFCIPQTVNEIIRSGMSTLDSIYDLENETEQILSTDRLQVIYSTSLKSVALDIESKFTEAGLASVHLSDIRNFAHGRHHWFDKVSSSGILCLVDGRDAQLGSKTLELLPEDVPKCLLPFNDEQTIGPIAGLIVSFYLTLWKGRLVGIDPGRPGVPRYGSKIYRLSTNPGFDTSMSRKVAAVKRKLAGSELEGLAAQLEEQYDRYLNLLKKQKIGGVVFDYDGTLVDSSGRGEPPKKVLCRQITRLLDAGIEIGFATGRGKSIREELKSGGIFPKKYHERILIGYYNGAVLGKLSDDSCPKSANTENHALINAFKTLSNSSRLKHVTPNIESREFQITAQPEEMVSETFLWEYASSLVSPVDRSELKILRSSHSIDIVPKAITKLRVVREIEERLKPGQIVLCIGDRGRWPGNDSELLGHDFSLSVDEISLIKDKCWNLCPAGYKGTQGTQFYLERLKLGSDGSMKFS